MKYCSNCNVFLNDDKEKCYLCNNSVETKHKKVNNQNYPHIYTRSSKNIKAGKVVLSILIFLTISLIAINIITYNNIPIYWSMISTITLLLCCLFFKFAFFSYKSLSLKLVSLHFLIGTFFIFLDGIFIYSDIKFWSITYVIPFLALIFLFVTLIIISSRKEAYKEYFGNIIINLLLLYLPLIFYIVFDNVVTNIIPPIICALLSTIILLCIFIFPSKQTKEELKKRMHI